MITLGDEHFIATGKTGVGKSSVLQLMCRALARDASEAFTLIDIHGEAARKLALWHSNPAVAPRRRVHFLNVASLFAFGANPLEACDQSFEACHDAAVGWASAIESHYEAAPEETPRMARLMYAIGMLAAYKQLTLLDVMQAISLGAGEDVRELLLQASERHPVLRGELQDLILLAHKHPREFLAQLESCRNRLLRWLGDPRLMRIFGQRNGLNPRRIMDARDIVIIDLSALPIADAAFLGTVLTVMYFTAAKRRPPHACPRHRLVGDEFESLLCLATAQLLDQGRKFGCYLVAFLQRLGQLRAKGDVYDSVMTNAGIKLVFNEPSPENARLLAEMLFTGYLPLNEYKKGTERPVLVGHDIRMARSRSRSEHRAEHEMVAEGESFTTSRARSTSLGKARGTSSATSTASSQGSAVGAMQAQGTSQGTSTGEVDTASLSLTPDRGFLFPPPVILGQGSAQSASSGALDVTSSSRGTSSITSQAMSRGRSDAVSNTHSEAVADTISEAIGYSRSCGIGKSVGTSLTEGESEMLVPKLEWLPSALYSLEEQRERAAGVIMTLQRRECFLKVASKPPVFMRTPDLTPAYRSAYFQRLMWPRWLRKTSEASPYLRPVAEVDAEITARYATPLQPAVQEPNFATAPMPVIDDPISFAKNFLATRNPRGANRELPGRKPVGDLPAKADRFRVIDGDDGDKPK